MRPTKNKVDRLNAFTIKDSYGNQARFVYIANSEFSRVMICGCGLCDQDGLRIRSFKGYGYQLRDYLHFHDLKIIDDGLI